MNAKALQFYFGRISSHLQLNPKDINNAVLFVGNRIENGKDDWLLKIHEYSHSKKEYFRIERERIFIE